MKTTKLAILTSLALAGASAQAATIVYEGFGYSAGTNTAANSGLATTTGATTTGTGLTGNYTMNRAANTNVNGSSFVSGSLSYGALPTTGGKLQWDGVNTTSASGNYLNAQLSSSAASTLAPTTSSQTIWMSFLMNSNAFAANQGAYLKNSAATGDATGANVFGMGIVGNQAFVAYNNTSTSSAVLVPVPSFNTTYWLVGNFSYSKSGSTTTYTAANMWLLSGGSIPGTEGALGTATASFSGSSTSVADRNPFSLSFMSGSSTADPFFDEVRLGDSYLSVIPEPATWALLAFSLATVVVLRSRRNS